MADISKITTLDGTTYDIKDSTARSNIPAAATSNPKMDGTAAIGTSAKYAKEDHVHPIVTPANIGAYSKSEIDSMIGDIATLLAAI